MSKERRGVQIAARETETSTTPRGGMKTKTSVERIANRARREPEAVYTALMHHFSEENLRACFQTLSNKKAPGVDGVTKEEYSQNLEENLQRLHQRIQQRSYRPKPVRPVEIPKEDGTIRQLGISCTEDKIVQEMARRILEAIYEPVFIESSYGFRPKRGCHNALRRLNNELMSQPVNWIVDLDLAQFFDTMPHSELLKLLAKRIKDRKFLSLIARMLKAGIQTPEGRVEGKQGSPQGSIVSPIIANILLDHVLDQWFTAIVT